MVGVQVLSDGVDPYACVYPTASFTGLCTENGPHPLGGEVASSRSRGLGPTFGHPGFGLMALPRVRPVRACTDGMAYARKERKVCVCVGVCVCH